MKFSIGDPVYIKANNEEGVIEEFIGKDMACVIVDKKSYHAYLDDLEHPYLRWFLKDNKVQRKKTPYIEQLSKEKFPERKSILPHGIYLVFMPVYKMEGFDEQVEKIKVYLYNETTSSYNFEYRCNVQGDNIFSIDSELHDTAQFYLHDIAFEDMATSPAFGYRFVDKENPQLDNESLLSIKPKKLFEQIEAIRYANNAFFHFLLYEKLVPRPKKEVILNHNLTNRKMNVTNPKNLFDFEQALRKSTQEVDLHIEKLIHDSSRMGASEILHIQLTACRNALDLAVATHQEALIIIHGIGKGVLKNEINSLLDQTKGIQKYVNEYDVRYGYGATKVFFRY